MLKVTVTANLSGIPAKISEIATNKALGQAAANQMKVLMEPYVPFDTGQLNGSAEVTPFAVTYTAPYAIYPYEGRRVSKYTREYHDRAQSHWDKGMDKAELAQFIENYIKGM